MDKNFQLSAISEGSNIFRYAAVVEYIGTNFEGSQIQPHRRTVQAELENALKVLVSKDVKTFLQEELTEVSIQKDKSFISL
jgi:tRNA pseudouridine(38-40) synthase